MSSMFAFTFKYVCILYQDVTSGYLLALSSAVLSGGFCFFSYSTIFSNFSSRLFIICGVKISGGKKNQDASSTLFLHPLMSINVSVCL